MRHTCSIAILVLLAGAHHGAAAADAAPPDASRRPNVVLLLADDLRADAVAALNPDPAAAAVRTPHLDALAREGTAFRNAYNMGSRHAAVCIPSRAMLLTGRSLFRLQGAGQVVPPAHPTYPELLRAAGYDTFAVGKWHNDRAAFARAFTGGGRLFFGGMAGHTGLPVHPFDPTGKYAGKGTPDPTGRYSTELFADDAVEFLRGRRARAAGDGGRPFYLHVAFTAPHDPREVPPGYERAYDPAAVRLPPNFLPRHPFDNGELAIRDEQLAPVPRDPAWVRRELAAYYAMVTHLDAQVGRVLATLREAGLDGETIVVFAADNGLALGGHGLLGKQNLYDHSARVPLIVRGPGVAAGKTSDALCYLLDLCPTVCEMAGVAAPAQSDGQSLLPVLRGDKAALRDGLLLAYRDVQRAYRDGRFKLIEYAVNGARRTQFFDLERDPAETTDLSADPAHAAALANLRRKLTDARAAAGDTPAPPAPAR